MRKKLDLREKLKKLSEERKDVPLLRAKKISEVPAKPLLLSIEELRFPHGLPFERAEVATNKERLEETLAHKGNSQIQLRWTVAEDAYAEEFGSAIKEGFTHVKSHPPTYAFEFEEGGVVATHLSSYTFILSSYNVNVKKLAEILEFAMNAVKTKIT